MTFTDKVKKYTGSAFLLKIQIERILKFFLSIVFESSDSSLFLTSRDGKSIDLPLHSYYLIFALDPKVIKATETFLFISGLKFMCLVVTSFHKQFCFWYQTEVAQQKFMQRFRWSKKSYTLILTVVQSNYNFSVFAQLL